MIIYDKKLYKKALRHDFVTFIAKVFSTINPGVQYQPNWHINLIAKHLEAIRTGQIKRLIINMPPRALKSVCISVAWPAWLLGHNPSSRIMAASYSSILSTKHSLDTRLVISSNWYKKLFPNTKIFKGHNQKSKFLTTKNGFRFALGVGGSATGEGGDFLIIDDPHNPTEINSTKMRNKAIEWFEQTFVTRLNDQNKGAIVLVMQRLHQDDLSAHLESSGNWTTLKIPAIAPCDIKYKLGDFSKLYKENELLNKRRDQREFLHNIEQEIGSRNYAAQFLQEPLPVSYSLLSLENIHYFEKVPERFDFFVHSWDTAIKVSEKTDYSVGTIWGILGDKYYLLGMIRKKLIYSALKNELEKQINKYNPRFVLIEDKASGQPLIQDLKLAGFTNIRAIKPTLDKVTRFAAIIHFFENGTVLIPNKSAFNQVLIAEITNFPGSKHDDIIDSISQFLNFIKNQNKNNTAKIRVL
jgi:predicted phage terminase large subunit-like protein